MVKNKISKSERRTVIILLGGILSWALIGDPIVDITTNIIPDGNLRLILGFTIIFLLAYFGRLNNVI